MCIALKGLRCLFTVECCYEPLPDYKSNYYEHFKQFTWPTYSDACTGTLQEFIWTVTCLTAFHSEPCQDYVEVYDGLTLGSRRLRRLCGQWVRYAFRTTTNKALVVFHSAGHRQQTHIGFKTNYSATGEWLVLLCTDASVLEHRWCTWVVQFSARVCWC